MVVCAINTLVHAINTVVHTINTVGHAINAVGRAINKDVLELFLGWFLGTTGY